jgi:O-Antigen ligase
MVDTWSAEQGPPPRSAHPADARESPPARPESASPSAPSTTARRNGMLGLVWFATVMLAFNVARVGEWAVSDWLYLVAAFVILAGLLTGQTRHLAHPDVRRTAPVLMATSLALLTAGTLSSLWSVQPFASMMVVLRFAWLTLGWFWVLRAVAVDHAALGKVVAGYKLAVLIGAVTAILGDMGLQISPDNWSGRQAGFWGHPNSLAAFLAVGVPLFLADVPRSADRPRGRPLWIRLGLTGFVLVAIGTTGSMTGWLAAAVGVVTPGVVFLLATDRNRMRFRPLTAMAATVVIGVGLVAFFTSDSPVVERMLRWRSGDTYVSGSVGSRAEHTEVVVSRIHERLLLGVGFDRDSTLLAAGDDASMISNSGGIHNMLLKLTYEAGLPACVAVLCLLLATANRAWRLALHTRGTPVYPLVLALLGSLMAINVNAQFQPVLFRRYYWFPVAVIWALYALCRHESRCRPEEVLVAEAGGGAPGVRAPAAGGPGRPGGNGRGGGNGLRAGNGSAGRWVG